MKRIHEMEFGTRVLEDGGVRFRLWAPGAEQVEVCVSGVGEEAAHAMAAQAGGWFDCAVAQARVGNRYQFRIDGEQRVPDPASRFQPDDVHGASEIIDPGSFDWRDLAWRGRPWEQAVVYELHVGSFSPEGTFAGLVSRLDHLVDLGITAIELMPVADFPGRWNWGYDGVLPFAPDSRYGRPEELKTLVAEAHARGLMVLLDVVYNHFGPDGNYLHVYAPQFFTDAHQTPWGAAINMDQTGSEVVRRFFIENALYWLEEYHLDGLRLDAVHAIQDDSSRHFLDELAAAVHAGPGHERRVHLVLENDHNAARYLTRHPSGEPRAYAAQWNDDIHHAMHTVVTGEDDGYYADYASAPLHFLGRCLAEGFAYQGEHSNYQGVPRGEPSADLPPTAFVAFLQNHDQVGNRAFGDRVAALSEPRALRAAVTLLLLSPHVPLLFMGEELGSKQPFPFFCDFTAELAKAVTEGRRGEFARFARFADPTAREAIPDPNDPATFDSARLDWQAATAPEQRSWLEFYRELLALRRRQVAPRLPGIGGGVGHFELLNGRGLRVRWVLAERSQLTLVANLGAESLMVDPDSLPGSQLLHAEPGNTAEALVDGKLPGWSVLWFLQPHSLPAAPGELDS
jgi:malto-oligosyltrehalose trehalohydrolase